MQQFIVFDTETTGLDVSGVDQVIEIGAMEFVNGEPSGNEFYTLVKAKQKINPNAQKVHGISDLDLVNAPAFSKIYKDFLLFIEGKTIIAHNASFDVSAIDKELERIGSGVYLEMIAGEIIDTLSIARNLWPGRKNNLDSVCDRLSVSRKNRKKHGALIDSYLLGNAFVKMLEYKKEDNAYKL